MSERDSDEKSALVGGLRAVRDEARSRPADRASLPKPPEGSNVAAVLPALESDVKVSTPHSPERETLNASWNVLYEDGAPAGALARLFAPLRGPLRRILRFALGPALERQVAMNSAQVRFDNELVEYLDRRLDQMSAHYDRVLGQHGRRMEEIDERHLVLQQELIRHVHDLVTRIEFVFESAETNHLYIDGLVREAREELGKLDQKLAALASTGDDGA